MVNEVKRREISFFIYFTRIFVNARYFDITRSSNKEHLRRRNRKRIQNCKFLGTTDYTNRKICFTSKTRRWILAIAKSYSYSNNRFIKLFYICRNRYVKKKLNQVSLTLRIDRNQLECMILQIFLGLRELDREKKERGQAPSSHFSRNLNFFRNRINLGC